MPSSIAQHLATSFPGFYGLKREDKRRYVETTLLFMMRGINTNQLNAALKELSGNKKKFRLTINGNGYLFNIKLWLLYCWDRQILSLDHEKAEKVLRHFQINSDDKHLLQFAVESKALTKLMRKHCKSFKILTQTKFREQVSDVAKVVESYAARFVGKKMKFITRANGYDIHDLSAELVCHGVQAVMNMYPCIHSPLHAQNIIKQAIHNSGINIIMHYTTQSRGTLVKNADGTFSSLKVSYDGLLKERKIYEANPTNTDGGGYATIGFGDEGDGDRDVVGDSIAAHQILDAYSGRRRRLLVLMCGELDVKFTRYLRRERVIRSDKDNEDLYHNLSSKDDGLETYIGHAMTYLKIPPKKGRRFLSGLRTSLGDTYRSVV